MRVFGRFGLEKLAARRSIEVKVAHFDAGAGRERTRRGCGKLRSICCDRPRVPVAGAAARERQVRYGGDACQRLAAKPQARNALEVGARDDLAGGVACKRERQLLLADAAAVIGHLDQLDAAARELDRDFPRAGVDAVFEQFLERGGRTVDHFAGGDLVDEQLGQDPDVRHAPL
jgi:hypothetical protein